MWPKIGEKYSQDQTKTLKNYEYKIALTKINSPVFIENENE